MLSLLLITSTIVLNANLVLCLDWVPAANGVIPANSFTYIAPKTRKSLHFCEVREPDTGRIHTGMFAEGENVCEFVDTETNEVGVSAVYDMLIKHPRDKLGWEWAYHGEVPANAIACEDTHLGGSNNCYLGVSMYSDGICKEAIGKIEAEEGMIHMSVNRESHICPFFLYLTLAPGVDGPRQRV